MPDDPIKSHIVRGLKEEHDHIPHLAGRGMVCQLQFINP